MYIRIQEPGWVPQTYGKETFVVILSLREETMAGNRDSRSWTIVI